MLEEWEDKYLLLIEWGERLPKLPESEKIETNRVQGCTSRVWIIGQLNESGQLNFAGESDSRIVKGLLAILLKLYSGLSPEEILEDRSNLIEELNFGANLMPARVAGFESMQAQIKQITQRSKELY
jgi:cysteine desulfuration protein SufE